MTGDTRRDGAWLRRFHPAPDAGVRLVCFPHAGGSATFYFPVSGALSRSMEVLAVQYPGRQDRHGEPCVSDIGELADRVVEELLSLDTKPLALFGHSMGATVAYEVARRLEGKGIKPLRLFVSGRRAPSRTRDENVHQRDDTGLIAELKRLGGTNTQSLDDPDVLRMILPAVRSDYKAVESYRHLPGPPLGCPVVALTGDDDPRVTLDEAKAWSEHTVGGFELKVYEGGHFYLNSHATAVTEAISAGIAEPSPTGPPASDR
ncbi:thioesterase II family protein [Streptomyces sp. NPDC020858]|uniref:thioesterase II family protein n=1 Tax=Streptomyces sp. NPDC020858 TaxID=3365097 RepID=UPI0037B374E4